MHSRELLALQRNDMPEALRQAQLQVGRYNDSWAGMRYLMYLALLGRSAETWSEFADLANRFGDADVWMAAFLAPRMQGLEGGGALLGWLADQHSRDTRRNSLSGALRERHAFMLLFIDRPPSDEALRTMQQVTAANNQAHYYVDLAQGRSEEHTSELQSPDHLVCRLLLEKKKKYQSPCQHCPPLRVRQMVSRRSRHLH